MRASKPKAEQTRTLRAPHPISVPWLPGPARSSFTEGVDGVTRVAIADGASVIQFGERAVYIGPGGVVVVEG